MTFQMNSELSISSFKVLIHMLLISSMIAERLGYTPNFIYLGDMESTFPGVWGSVGWVV